MEIDRTNYQNNNEFVIRKGDMWHTAEESSDTLSRQEKYQTRVQRAYKITDHPEKVRAVIVE